jgi:hypothetical protein
MPLIALGIISYIFLFSSNALAAIDFSQVIEASIGGVVIWGIVMIIGLIVNLVVKFFKTKE